MHTKQPKLETKRLKTVKLFQKHLHNNNKASLRILFIDLHAVWSLKASRAHGVNDGGRVVPQLNLKINLSHKLVDSWPSVLVQLPSS